MTLFANNSLQKKMTLLFACLVTPPCVALCIYLFQYFGERQRQEHIRQYEALLRSAEQTVTQSMATVESIVNVFAYSEPVGQLLSESAQQSDRVITLLYPVLSEIRNSRTYLGDYRADLALLSAESNIYERTDAFEKLSRYGDHPDITQFWESEEKTTWGQLEVREALSPWNDTGVNQAVLPYYQKVYTGISGPAGLVRCRVQADRLFASVYHLAEEGVVMVWMEGVCVIRMESTQVQYHPTSDETDLSADNIRLSNGYTNHGYMLTLDLPEAQLKPEAGGVLVLIVCISALAYGLMLILVQILVRSVMSRLRFAVDAMSALNPDKRNLQIPYVGGDEVGRMIMAVNQLLQRIDGQYEELLEKERDKRSFQLSALQFQMNPHFLFNSLHWLQLKMEELQVDPAVTAAVEALGEVYRYNLSNQRSATLDEEIRHARSYVSYMQALKENRISLQVYCEEHCKCISIPRFTLQPIIENAIKHGMEFGTELRIAVHITREAQALTIQVDNNGRNVPQERVEAINRSFTDPEDAKSVGLQNLIHRLRLTYGDGAELTLCSSENITSLVMRIPLLQLNGGETQG